MSKSLLLTICALTSVLPSCTPFQKIRDTLKHIDVHMGVDYVEENDKGEEVHTEIFEWHDLEEKIFIAPAIKIEPQMENNMQITL